MPDRYPLDVILSVGGRSYGRLGAVIEAWGAALESPVRLGGTPVAIHASRLAVGRLAGVLGEDVEVELSAADDRYASPLRFRPPGWRPLGLKSGPNLQWFLLLRALAGEGRGGWVLLIEPDTAPVGASVLSAVRGAIERHPDAWIIGARPHPNALPTLDPDLRDHLNGAALYHVGSPEFVEFLATV